MHLHTLRPIPLLLLSLFAAGAPAGCAGKARTSAYSTPSQRDRDSTASQRLAQQGAAMMSTDPAAAERCLRQALAADLFNGPAHNNLGVLYLAQDKLYLAAGEFEWARQLLPGHADPRMNLALTLERAGRTDEAISAYRTAMEVAPEHIASVQALTRLQIRSGVPDDATRTHLQEIAIRGETPAWRDWARLQLTLSTEPRR